MRFFLFIYYAELNLKIERFFIGAKLVTENDAGALVYFRPESMPMPKEELTQIDNQLRKVCGADYSKAVAFIDGLEQYHPHAFRHYYISRVSHRPIKF